MGDRVSVSFKKGDYESVTLFSHWGGKEFAEMAQEYANKLMNKKLKDGPIMPLDRLEPETVMVDFIRYVTENMEEVAHDLYLGKDQDDGDNSDNGHFVIQLHRKEKK